MAPTYKTIIGLHAWVRTEGGDQTYADADAGEDHDGWNIHLQHRDPETDALLDPEGAPELDVDLEDYAAAYLIAAALATKYGWELREY